MGKQQKKGLEDSVGGYIEITGAGWKEAITRGRLVYNYVENEMYLSADHYQSGDKDNPFVRIDIDH
jgi:hypothetical protein